jgi:hypothetical protein
MNFISIITRIIHFIIELIVRNQVLIDVKQLIVHIF